MSTRPEQPQSLFSERILATLRAPDGSDSDRLEVLEGALRSSETGRNFAFEDGVPSLMRDSEEDGQGVRTKVRGFYEENPFPSYEGLEEFGELVQKGRGNPFTTRLLKAIGYNKMVLEWEGRPMPLLNSCSASSTLGRTATPLALATRNRTKTATRKVPANRPIG